MSGESEDNAQPWIPLQDGISHYRSPHSSNDTRAGVSRTPGLASPYQHYTGYLQHFPAPESGYDISRIRSPSNSNVRARSESSISNSSFQSTGQLPSAQYEPDIPANVPQPSPVVTTQQRVSSVHHAPRTPSPPIVEAHDNSHLPSVDIDRDHKTRNICILALILGWGVSFATLALGIYITAADAIQVPSFLLDRAVLVGTVGFSWITPSQPEVSNPYLSDHRVYHVSETAMIAISLFLTIGLTTILESMNFIQATSLRWALWRERRGMCNSNMCLFTYSRHHWPNWWLANIVSAVGLVFAYGGITLLTFNVYIIAILTVVGENEELDKNVPGLRYGIDFNAWGLIGVGSGTFLQALISTSCLIYKGGSIATWSSNPLATAKPCRFMPQNYGSGTSYISVRTEQSRSEISTSHINTLLLQRQAEGQHSAPQPTSDPDLPPSSTVQRLALSRPRTRQRSAFSAIQYAPQFATLIWGFFAIFCVLVVIIAILAKKFSSLTADYVEEAGGCLDFLSYVQNLGQVSIAYTDNSYTKRREWLGLIIQSVVLSLVLADLHLVEYLTLLIRDEKIWRKATSRDGARVDSSTLLQSATIWQYWFLCASKSIVPWVFSYGFSCNTMVFMNLIPLAILAALSLVLALFAEGLIRWQPKGTQPSTYGNISALLALVDDWDHETLFWGQKGELVDNIGNAGTSGSRLADVKMGILYTRLRASLGS